MCCPEITVPLANLTPRIQTGSIILFNNDVFSRACVRTCCCCCCRDTVSRWISSWTCDMNNACCARRWSSAGMLVRGTRNRLYVFVYHSEMDTLANSGVTTPVDALTNTVVDRGFRLLPLDYVLRESYARGARVHAVRIAQFRTALEAKNFGDALINRMRQMAQTCRQQRYFGRAVADMRTRGGPTSHAGDVSLEDSVMMAASDPGYMVFFFLRILGQVRTDVTRNEKYYDVEDLLHGGHLDKALKRPGFYSREFAFEYTPPQPVARDMV